MTETLYLAGGCFWGMEGYYKRLAGVVDTEVGYANGKSPQATYQGLKSSNHAETLAIHYDPNQIDLATLISHFFRVIDPFSLNKQGGDVGRQYRTGIYTTSASQEAAVKALVATFEQRAGRPTAVEVVPLAHFVPAEDYHQDYLDKHPGGYCHIKLAWADQASSPAENLASQEGR